MKCQYCRDDSSNKYIHGYCNACWQRIDKTGDVRLKCLTGIHSVGVTKHPLYNTWVNMKTRCYNKNCRSYSRYGGRGIMVCDRWLEKPFGFLNFIHDMGEKPSDDCSLDRIDNNLGYSPANCRWATIAEQNLNRRTNNKHPGVCWAGCSYKAYITINGKTLTKRFSELDEAIRWRREKELLRI